MKSENLNNPHTNALDSSQKSLIMSRVGTIVEMQCDVKGYPPNYPKTENWTNEDINGNYRGPLYKVAFQADGEDESFWIPPIVLHASSQHCVHSPFVIGEQVVVLSINGNEMNSYIIGALYHDAARPPISHDQPTSDGRAWDTGIIQHYTPDMYTELRLSSNKHVPSNPRFLIKWLGGYLLKFIIKPSKALFVLFVKTLHLKADKQIIIESDGIINIKSKLGIFIDGGHSIVMKADDILIQDKVPDKHGHRS